MVAGTYLTPSRLKLIKSAFFEVMEKTAYLLRPKSLAVLYREPLVDEECPEASDVDLLAIWELPEEFPERITVESQLGRVFIDILWIPVSKMLNPIEAASYKMLPHLFLESNTAWLRSDTVRDLIDNIKLKVHDKIVWQRRIFHHISFGDAALEEAQKNIDFPPAALFFLQAAHANYIVALADCLKQSTMNLLTHPLMKLRRMTANMDYDLEKLLKTNLYLDVEPSDSLLALQRVYTAVAAKCSGKQPHGVSMRTRGHYTYSISPLEIEYRTMFAEALIKRRDYANANFYLRFWAYSLSRCSVVLEEARLGRKPSFYVPLRAFKESVTAVCPEILDDITTILGGGITSKKIKESIDGTATYKRLVIDQINARGIKVT